MVAFLHEDTPLPSTVLLEAILYNITEHEGLIVFSEAAPMYGYKSIFSFYRDSAGSWKVIIEETLSGMCEIGPGKIVKAYELIQYHRGDSFGRPYPLPDDWSDNEWCALVNPINK